MPKLPSKWLAAQYMVVSTLAFTAVNATVKYLDHLPAFELVFFRAAGTFILCMLYLRRKRIPLFGQHRMLLIARGVVGLIAMSMFFVAVKLMPLGTVTSLRYLSPVFAAVFAIFLLNEKVRPIQWLYFAVALTGVFILKGFDGRVSLTALTVITISAIFSGLVYIIIRKIGDREHPVVIVNYFMFIAMLGGGLVTLFNWQMPLTRDWLILLSLGVSGYFGQLYMTKAFQIAAASKIAPLKYLEVVFALLVGWSYFGEIQTGWALVGIAMIIAGMLLNLNEKNA